MRNLQSVVVAALIVALTACSGSRSSNASTSATDQPAANQPSASNAAGHFPLYPGATPLAMQLHRTVKACGTTASVSVYAVKDADAPVVTKWYQTRLPDAVVMTDGMQRQTRVGTGTGSALFAADGTGGVVVLQMAFTSSQAAEIAKRFGAGRTTIAVENFEPAIPSSVMALLRQGAAGDAATRDKVRQEIQDRCGKMFGHLAA